MVYLITLLSRLCSISVTGMITDAEEQKSLNKNLSQGQFLSRMSQDYTAVNRFRGDGSFVCWEPRLIIVICV